MSIPILMEPSGYTLGFISSTQIGHSNNVRKLYLYTNSYFVLMWMHPFDNTKTALPKWWRSSGSYASKTRPRNLLSDTAGSPPVCGHLPDNEPERKRTNHSTWNEPKVQVDALHTHTSSLTVGCFRVVTVPTGRRASSPKESTARRSSLAVPPSDDDDRIFCRIHQRTSVYTLTHLGWYPIVTDGFIMAEIYWTNRAAFFTSKREFQFNHHHEFLSFSSFRVPLSPLFLAKDGWLYRTDRFRSTSAEEGGDGPKRERLGGS